MIRDVICLINVVICSRMYYLAGQAVVQVSPLRIQILINNCSYLMCTRPMSCEGSRNVSATGQLQRAAPVYSSTT